MKTARGARDDRAPDARAGYLASTDLYSSLTCAACSVTPYRSSAPGGVGAVRRLQVGRASRSAAANASGRDGTRVARAPSPGRPSSAGESE